MSHNNSGEVDVAQRKYPMWDYLNVYIEESLIRYLSQLGGGDPAVGVKMAVEYHQARNADLVSRDRT